MINHNHENQKKLLTLIKQRTIPAIGCTEPVAIAFATAIAKEHLEKKIGNINLEKDITTINIQVSINIFKNGKSVIIPNTNKTGLDLAAALSLVCGNSANSLCIFADVNKTYIKKANNILKRKLIKIIPVLDVNDVFVQVELKGEKNNVKVVLEGGHTDIKFIEIDGEKVFEDKSVGDKTISSEFLKKMTFNEIKKISEEIDIKELDFILEGIDINKKAAQEGLKKKNSLRWGASLLKLQKEGKIANDASIKARILTAAGADIRMGGGNCPIMTSGGSGNQGLGVILPIFVVAEEVNASQEKLIRATFFGHAINNFIKAYTGKLSAICGCAIGAGIGASAGITWLLGGKEKEIEGAAQNMLANITGMLCDGAKESCSLKLSTSAGEAVIASYMAYNNVIIPLKVGIIGNSIEETIKNIAILCKKGLSKTDETIVEIMKA